MDWRGKFVITSYSIHYTKLYDAQMASETAAKASLDYGLKTVEVYVKGPGSGREAAIRALQVAGLEITSIKDVSYNFV